MYIYIYIFPICFLWTWLGLLISNILLTDVHGGNEVKFCHCSYFVQSTYVISKQNHIYFNLRWSLFTKQTCRRPPLPTCVLVKPALLINTIKQIGFPASGRFHDGGRFSNKTISPRIGPEVTVGCLAVFVIHDNFIWNVPGPLRTKIA